MSSICAHAAVDGSYYVDVVIGSRCFHLMIDSGFVDSLDEVGIALEGPIFDLMTSTGILQNPKLRLSFDANGNQYYVNTAWAVAQLVDSTTAALVGPKVRVRASRGHPGVASRVGVAFFHRLAGCRVIWDLDQRTWCIAYP